jgi:hypothetical protein
MARAAKPIAADEPGLCTVADAAWRRFGHGTDA